VSSKWAVAGKGIIDSGECSPETFIITHETMQFTPVIGGDECMTEKGTSRRDPNPPFHAIGIIWLCIDSLVL